MPVTRNLGVFEGIFSVSVSMLHLIMPPIKVAGSRNSNSAIDESNVCLSLLSLVDVHRASFVS